MTNSQQELQEIVSKLEETEAFFPTNDQKYQMDRIINNANKVGESWSGSNLGYHANIYYNDLERPPAGAHFSQEWGLRELYGSNGTTGDWTECDPDKIKEYFYPSADKDILKEIKINADRANEIFEDCKIEILSVFSHLSPEKIDDRFLNSLMTKIEDISIPTLHYLMRAFLPNSQIMTRDTIAGSQGLKVAPHQEVLAEVVYLKGVFREIINLKKLTKQIAKHLSKITPKINSNCIGTNIFIGHGRSFVWRDLKDFIQDRLGLPWDEFNRVPVAGVTNIARLDEMLNSASMGFIVMTGEDELEDGELNARLNVIHEVGLFQGRLGFTKAIVLLEEGCQEFSNIEGLGQIRFPKDDIRPAFEEIRRVLEREGLLEITQ